MSDKEKGKPRPWDEAASRENQRAKTSQKNIAPAVEDSSQDDKDETHMRIRVPGALRNQLIALAEHNGRSLNAEVLARLIASIDDTHQIEDVSRLAEYHEKRIDNLEVAMRKVFKQLLPDERFFKPLHRED